MEQAATVAARASGSTVVDKVEGTDEQSAHDLIQESEIIDLSLMKVEVFGTPKYMFSTYQDIDPLFRLFPFALVLFAHIIVKYAILLCTGTLRSRTDDRLCCCCSWSIDPWDLP